jgi:hypothetical protein
MQVHKNREKPRLKPLKRQGHRIVPQQKWLDDQDNILEELGTPVGEPPHLNSYRMEGGAHIYILRRIHPMCNYRNAETSKRNCATIEVRVFSTRC